MWINLCFWVANFEYCSKAAETATPTINLFLKDKRKLHRCTILRGCNHTFKPTHEHAFSCFFIYTCLACIQDLLPRPKYTHKHSTHAHTQFYTHEETDTREHTTQTHKHVHIKHTHTHADASFPTNHPKATVWTSKQRGRTVGREWRGMACMYNNKRLQPPLSLCRRHQQLQAILTVYATLSTDMSHLQRCRRQSGAERLPQSTSRFRWWRRRSPRLKKNNNSSSNNKGGEGCFVTCGARRRLHRHHHCAQRPNECSHLPRHL